MKNSEPNSTPFIFGEVLFDVFPDDKEILGGAPFNVAWHLQGLGCPPLMISRVGRDGRGERILDRMRQWGMTVDGMQTDPDHPTGEVQVTFESGEPKFGVLANRAYDFIEPEPIGKLMETHSPALLYHGTLALRSPMSRQTLLAFRGRYKVPAFIDVNLRDPWWDEGHVRTYLDSATWIKLNEAELKQVEGIAGDVHHLLEKPEGDMVIVTRGEEGASLFAEGRPALQQRPPKLDRIEDTVGAGDAFSAVAILGILRRWPPEVLLARALNFAALLCTIQGAVPEDRAFYESIRQQWEDEDRTA